MKMTNQEIYIYAIAYNEAFKEFSEYIPAKINFVMQKNVAKLTEQAKSIDEARSEVVKHYGEPVEGDENEAYKILPENQEIAIKELNELFAVEQDLDIKKFAIDDLGDVKLTPQQMNAIMFMIEE